MKLALALVIAACLGLAGCWYTSQPTESPIGTNCTTSTYGLGFISSPNTTCEQSAQPPVGNAPAQNSGQAPSNNQ